MLCQSIDISLPTTLLNSIKESIFQTRSTLTYTSHYLLQLRFVFFFAFFELYFVIGYLSIQGGNPGWYVHLKIANISFMPIQSLNRYLDAWWFCAILFLVLFSSHLSRSSWIILVDNVYCNNLCSMCSIPVNIVKLQAIVRNKNEERVRRKLQISVSSS